MGAVKSRGARLVALVLAVVVLVILATAFRGLWFVALPLDGSNALALACAARPAGRRAS